MKRKSRIFFLVSLHPAFIRESEDTVHEKYEGRYVTASSLSHNIEIINNKGTQFTNMPVIQITISLGRSLEQKRELIKVLTKETARIMKTDEEKVRVLIYEVSKENWGNAGVLGVDMK